MKMENGDSAERPEHPVRLGKVLSIISLTLSVMAWFFAPAHLFYYVAGLLRPLLAQYSHAACDSTIPAAAVMFGLWAAALGRRECGTTLFVTAIIGVIISLNLVAANFYVASIFAAWGMIR